MSCLVLNLAIVYNVLFPSILASYATYDWRFSRILTAEISKGMCFGKLKAEIIMKGCGSCS